MNDQTTHSPLRVGVIGLGSMGKHHLRVWSQTDGVELVGVCDTDLNRTRAIMQSYPEHIHRYADVVSMFELANLDAVSICVPTIYHYTEALFAIKRGCHVLLEKPITESPIQALDLSSLAKRNGLVLAVGHIERYNPAVITAMEHYEAIGPARAIHCRRVGPSPERIRDVGVVVDLAVHDLDLMAWFTEEEPTVLASHLYHCCHGPQIEDGADVLLGLGDIAGFLTTNWLTPAKIRDLTIVGEKGTLIADLFHKKVELWQRYDLVENLRCTGKEPLAVEIEEFVKAVRGEPSQIVTAAEATTALACALQILEKGR